MIEFGKTLREAREAKGLTIGQLAEQTHILSVIVENLENEDFSRIVAPIYGRGFVKLYCEAVGIADPKPLTETFTELYNAQKEAEGDEPPRRRPPVKRTVTTPDPQPAPPDPQPATSNAQLETRNAQLATRDSQPATSNPQPETRDAQPETRDPQPATPVPQPAREPDLFSLSSEPPAIPSRAELFEAAARAVNGEPPHAGAEPLAPEDRHFRPRVPQFPRRPPSSVIRFAILGLVAILILWGLIAGLRGLYRLTMAAPNEPDAKTEVNTAPPAEFKAETSPQPNTEAKPKVEKKSNAVPKKSAPGNLPKSGRKPVDVPPLYF